MGQRIFRRVSLGIMMCVLATGLVFAGSPLPNPPHKGEGILTVNIQGVFNAKVSLSPFKGLKLLSP